MRFSQDGPDFPADLLDALLAGEVVFVCGAGVSAPQLPGFAGLVTCVYQNLRMEPDRGEKAAIEGMRYEEVLGSLARRIVHEGKMYEAVETILRPPLHPDLSNHHTLLRLSRDLDNRYSVVTTNFDTLFERAVAEERGPESARRVSIAGQSLPAPGSEQFGGIIHLHGRLVDHELGLARTPVVLTSAEYGDAYMRSGWASRFLFDLARCKTLVLIGYRAGDAPVRYFLNVVQADRERFTDLKPVYALDAIDGDKLEAAELWSLVAVEAIPYRRRTDGSPEHNALWHDLAQLAELVERPKPARRQRTQEILAKPYASSTAQDRTDLAWLIKGKGDLWDVMLASVDDAEWIDHFSREQLWRTVDPIWFIPQWSARGWTDIRRLLAAARWCSTSDAELPVRIERTLFHTHEAIPPLWKRAWHLLTRSNIERARLRRTDNLYEVAQSLRRGSLLDLDIRKGVEALTPHLMIESPWPGEVAEGSQQKLRDLYRTSLTVGSIDEVGQVAEALGLAPHARRICEAAGAALRSTVATARDAELIEDQWDSLESSVPSVEDHEQNHDHDGVIHLVNLLIRLLPNLAAEDHAAAISMVEDWRNLPSRLGSRMWLHALRNERLYQLDEVLAALSSLASEDFWAHRREIILVMQDRLADTAPAQIEPIIERVEREGPLLFEDLPSRDGMDWRPYARDHAMWLRLLALQTAGALTPHGRELLDQILVRTPQLQRNVEEIDLFASYSSGVFSVVGDPAPLLEAAPEEVLNVAHELKQSRDFNAEAGWSAYCRANPPAAFEALTRHGFRSEDVDLWRDLVNAVAFPVPAQQDQARARSRLIGSIFHALEPAPEDALQGLAPSLVRLFNPQAGVPARVRRVWWDRLWQITASDQPQEDEPADERFYDRVVNSTPGKLAEDLLLTIEVERRERGRPTRASMGHLRTIMRDDGQAGHMARGACARSVGFLVNVDEPFVRREFLPRLREDSRHGAILRAVILEWAQLGAVATKVLKSELIRGVVESTAISTHAQNAAAKVLLPRIWPRLAKDPVDAGFEDGDTARALKLCGDNIRVAAAQWLAIWQKRATDPGPAEVWSKGVLPLFEAVWPQEGKFKQWRITIHLADCCAHTGDRFPEALEVFRPYLTTSLEGSADLFFLFNNDVAKRFPAETLDLLWALLRLRKESVGMPNLATALDEIKAAAPNLELDRRFQWLETVAVRFA
jgi:SIR2-like domain